jgi:hypothetical protein
LSLFRLGIIYFFFISASTPILPLKSKLGVEIATQLREQETIIFTSIVYALNWLAKKEKNLK